MAKVLGIDIGGTKIRMGVIDGGGQILYEEQIPTQIPLYPYLEENILRVLAKRPEISAIGVGTHGFVDPKQGKVIYAAETLPGWTDTPVKAWLEKATGKRVEVENDANAVALAEAKFGAARGLDRVVVLTLGTGLGGGVLWDGKLLSGGPHGGAAELGHMILYPNGVKCACGRLGCSEMYVSGTALRRRISEAGLAITPPELFENARTDPAAKQVVEEFTRDLAFVISSLQAAFDMEMVIIGGGVSEAADLWMESLQQQLKPVLLNPLDVAVARFENDAGILGAALLVLDD
ncbi:ROK family protein [Planococcus antarcticus DSM 14505]|uniref:ROK family protein n=1 Tax=Planococcus antarcticus DSM 14505 TaxID=1185653 RepID=A0A1C7DKR8_9BACL|nr:ROK family protein [Planococcus antarcticus]ANU12017.1 sugar kinase [Planococcus antarcticus DSM 14505]EIM07999.1 ROK family protein [Planococcus antarcticus DSM 14505]